MFKKTGKTEQISNPKEVKKDKVKKADKTGILITNDGEIVKVEIKNVRKDG